MKWLRDLKNKTWIEWLKIIVAIDIASVGIGLIIDLNFHVFANILSIISLGFISRIIMGVMYIFVAMLILKRIFPAPLQVDEVETLEKKEDMDKEVKENIKEGKHLLRKFIKWIVKINDDIIDYIDRILDRIEIFFTKKKKEVKKEVKNLLEK